MKKLRIISLALAAVLCLSGCHGTNTPDETTPPTEPTVNNATTEPVIPPDVTPTYENMYSAALPITTENYHTEDNVLIFSYSYQTIYPVLPDRDVSDKLIMNFTDRIEKTRSDSQEVLELAESLYSPDSGFIPLSYEVQYDVTRIDQGVLSLFGHILQTSDSARTNRSLVSANYDLVTGDVLTVGSILYHIDTKDDLAALVISNLEKRDDIMLFEEFRDTVEARFERDESTDEDFYFSNTGLCFYFAPYEIAPGAYGTVIVEIPYNELTGIIGDAFFPAERTYTSGAITIESFQNADLESYTQFVEIVAEPESTKLLLTTDSAVQDIRILELIWAKDGMSYTQTKNIYAANFLSSENALLLEAEFDNFRPNYMLSYSIEGSTYVFYLVKDPATGEISLTSLYNPT